jgi:hypothetical protein
VACDLSRASCVERPATWIDSVLPQLARADGGAVVVAPALSSWIIRSDADLSGQLAAGIAVSCSPTCDLSSLITLPDGELMASTRSGVLAFSGDGGQSWTP